MSSSFASVQLGEPSKVANPDESNLVVGSLPPKGSHPTARAFFDALDLLKQGNVSTTEMCDGKSHGDGKESVSKSSSLPRIANSSSLIHKRIQTLGWRNRHSQADQYPIHIQTTIGTNQDDCKAENVAENCSHIPLQQSNYSFSVRQVQRGEVEGTFGTGATVWPASLVLIYYLQQHQLQLRQANNNVTIVELGAGTGVVSIAAAVLFGNSDSTTSTANRKTRVVCTDGCQAVVHLARDNILQAAQQLLLQGQPLHQPQQPESTTTVPWTSVTENPTSGTPGACPAYREAQHCKADDGSGNNDDDSASDVLAIIHGCPVQVMHYWWGTKPLPTSTRVARPENPGTTDPSTLREESTTTIVLVSDCVLPKLYPIAPLVDALSQLLVRPMVDVAYISYEHRYYSEYDPREFFREQCQAHGLEVHLIPTEEQHSVYSVDDIELWKVERVRSSLLTCK